MPSTFVAFSAVAVLVSAFVSPTQATISKAENQSILKVHNTLCAKHHAPALIWNEDLAADAQQWSEGCVKHPSTNYGQNAAHGFFSFEKAINSWNQKNTMYFTQVIRKSSLEIGCGSSVCTPNHANQNYYTCNYSPAGNTRTAAAFAENVLAP